MTRQIVTAPDPVLHAVAAPVTGFGTSWLEDLVADMARIRREMGGAGIAAPQVGESVRIFLLDARRTDGTVAPRHAGIVPMVVANPVIEARHGDPEPGEEGCLSIPATLNEAGRISVRRVPVIDWSGQDMQGAPIGGRLDGFAARAFQHELDHLDGILITDPARDAM
ncbi:peptide deformylase [Roseobacter sp. HKCCA0434]|uniref:peptide deformylase n=1 Tax=Roseobacter sp. HKCCA0434 TaxID=3079297 RepID=UPI0029057E54|nr:peptide deformylase [Roseobacter sp. HKCCA0434]